MSEGINHRILYFDLLVLCLYVSWCYYFLPHHFKASFLCSYEDVLYYRIRQQPQSSLPKKRSASLKFTSIQCHNLRPLIAESLFWTPKFNDKDFLNEFLPPRLFHILEKYLLRKATQPAQSGDWIQPHPMHIVFHCLCQLFSDVYANLLLSDSDHLIICISS